MSCTGSAGGGLQHAIIIVTLTAGQTAQEVTGNRESVEKAAASCRVLVLDFIIFAGTFLSSSLRLDASFPRLPLEAERRLFPASVRRRRSVPSVGDWHRLLELIGQTDGDRKCPHAPR